MSATSSIEWTEATWNPVVGCTHVSAGCDNCYAAREASGRLSKTPTYAGLASGGKFTGEVRLLPERLDQPLRWRRPRRIFVNSMSDLFHDGVPDDFIARVFAVMAEAPRHTFQVLTKRHGRMRSLLSDPDWTFQGKVGAARYDLGNHDEPSPDDPSWGWPLPNVWLGVSVEDQRWADIRIPALLDTPAAVRWISAEPLLGPVNLKRWLWEGVSYRTDYGTGVEYDEVPSQVLDWVVTGGESGPGARPMHPDWARSLRDQCQAAGVPYLHKQNGEWVPVGPVYEQPDDDGEADEARMEAVDLEVRGGKQVVELERSGYIAVGYQPADPRTWLMARVGKKAAGRELDGRTWDEYPDGAR